MTSMAHQRYVAAIRNARLFPIPRPLPSGPSRAELAEELAQALRNTAAAQERERE